MVYLWGAAALERLREHAVPLGQENSTKHPAISALRRHNQINPAVLALLLASGISAAAQSMPAEMREVLTSEFAFSPADIQNAESGRPVAKIAGTGRPDDVRLLGVILIKASSAEFIKAFRDVEHFQTGKEVLRTGRFSSPPVEADVAALHIPDLNKLDLFACRPGSCAYKMPTWAMEDLKTKIDWNAPGAAAQADKLIRKVLVARLGAYQRAGDAALEVNYDAKSPYSVADGLHSLIGEEVELGKRFPDLVRYARDFPAHKPARVEDLFYWQEATFGLKHVVRTQHVMIQELPREGGSHYAIVSKMLFATHYFRAAFEFSYVYPVRTDSGEPAIYFVAAQRSYVDGLTGMTGAVLRRITDTRSPASLSENLRLAQERLERKH